MLVDAKTYAHKLGISRATLTRYVQSGRIVPAFKGDGIRGAMMFQDLDATPPEVVAPNTPTK
jgi:predicted site-specific integrase-resolvase